MEKINGRKTKKNRVAQRSGREVRESVLRLEESLWCSSNLLRRCGHETELMLHDNNGIYGSSMQRIIQCT